MASATRPISAHLIPLALVIVGMLDLGAALVHGGRPQAPAAGPAIWAYLATAFGGAVELTAALLIVMQRTLGRRLYLLLLPARIAVAFVAALLAYGTGPAAGSAQAATALETAMFGIGLDIAIYAALVFAMFRPTFSEWLTSAAPGSAGTADTSMNVRTESTSILAHTGVRIAAFVGILLLIVFVLDGPVELLWIGAVVVPLMLGVRAYVKRR